MISLPLVPPRFAPVVEGQWEESVTADGVRALFHDGAGTLRGFALVGAATKDKQALTKNIPPLLSLLQLQVLTR